MDQLRTSRKTFALCTMILLTLFITALFLIAFLPHHAEAVRKIPSLSQTKSDEASGTHAPQRLNAQIQSELSASAPWRGFTKSTAGSWQVVWNERSRTAHKVWGGPLRLVDPRTLNVGETGAKKTLEAATRNFMDSNRGLFGVSTKNLKLVKTSKHGRIWYVLYQQYHKGLLIHDSTVHFQIAENGNLATFGADAYSKVVIPDEPTIPKIDAIKIARADAGFVIATDSSTPPETVIYPLPLKSTVAFRRAWTLKVRTHAPDAQWVYFIDAVTGKILEKYNEIRYAAVSGTISGNIHPEYQNDTEESHPFADEQVRIGYSVLYRFDLNTNPGWTTQGGWQFGTPLGQGGNASEGLHPDPTSGHTGSYVYGYNLSGNYPESLSSTEYLTTPAIDCSSISDTHLRLWRWLGVESMFEPGATVEVSNNGTDWHMVWGQSSPTTNDGSWVLKVYDISDIADGHATVYVRWGIGPVFVIEGIFPARCGWNIDDIEIYGLAGSGGSATTNTSGAYSVTLPDGSYRFESGVAGTYAEAMNESGNDALYETTASTGSPVSWTWSNTNSAAPERNVYYHVQLVHNFIKALDPSFTDMDHGVPATVGIADGLMVANAFWDGVGVNFGAGIAGSTGDFGLFADVIYHEYGHGITQYGYAPLVPSGAMHEGFSDYTASTITDDPEQGENGLIAGEPYMRTLENTLRTPDDLTGESHDDGRILGGALWDLRQSIGATLADNLWHFARFGGGVTFEDYLTDMLVVDDDDGNLANGTPHFVEINTAFGNNHGIGPGYGLFIDDIHVDDSAGDGDGVIDAGEHIVLTITLVAHNVDTTNISATLSTASSDATVTQNYSTFPNALRDHTTVCNTAYAFTASSSVPGVKTALFDLTITANSGSIIVPEKFSLAIIGNVSVLVIGSSANGVISAASEVDWYMFHASSGQVITADIDADVNGSLLDSVLSLYDSDGSTLLEYNFGSYDSTIAGFRIPHDGWYFLTVRDFWGNGGSSYFYTISLSEVATPRATIDVSSLAFAPAASGTQTKRIRITNIGTMPVKVIACDRAPGSSGWRSPGPAESPWVPIIVDAPTDSPSGVKELELIEAYKTASSVEVRVTFTGSIAGVTFGGYLGLDLDQNPLTGYPPFLGSWEQDIGCEVDVILVILPTGAAALGTWAGTEDSVFTSLATIAGNTLRFSIPLAAVGDDGNMDVAASVYDFSMLDFDYAPDVGHGTIGTDAHDAPALSVQPRYVFIPVRGGAMIEVTADATALSAAQDSGTVVLYTNMIGGSRIEIPTTIDKQTDADSDGLPDAWEMARFGNLGQSASGDPDGDGLTNLQEYSAGTNPLDADSDHDGLRDSAEWNDLNDMADGIQNPFNPTNPDSTGNNGSGLPNGVPDGQDDFDGDGISNQDEIAQGTSPIIPAVPTSSLIGTAVLMLVIFIVGCLIANSAGVRPAYYAGSVSPRRRRGC